MAFRDSFIAEYAGPPARVAVNLLIIACAGILGGHLLFGAPLDTELVLAAMLPALGAVVAAGILKANR